MGAEQEAIVLEFMGYAHGQEQDADAMAGMMSDDIVWQVNVPSWTPRTGREACRAELLRQNEMSTGGLDGCEVLNIASNDRVVFTERVDVFETMGKTVTLRTNAVYEVEGGRIAAWREYYDSVALAKQLGIAPELVVENDP